MVLALTSQAQLTVSGEFRPRMEYRHGFASLPFKDQDPALFVEQRARLNAFFEQEKYTVKLVFQDVRTWGSQSQLVNNGGALTAMHEAWGRLKISDQVGLKLGRQEIILDDSRIFGNVGWAQQARSHDAIMLDTKSGDLTFKFAVAYNQDKVQSTTNFYSVARSYKSFQFAWLKTKLGSANASFLLLNNGLQGGTLENGVTYFSQTLGTNLSAPAGNLTPGGSFYFQTGLDGNGTKMNAMQFMVNLKYKASEKLNLILAFESLSGNDQIDPSEKNEAFNPFYGTNHKFNGLMDYFYVGNHANSVGLNDLFLQLSHKGKKWQTQATYHYFSSHADILLDPETNFAADKYLGSEVDLVFSHQSSEDVNIKIGYSQLFGSDSMVLLKDGDTDALSNWGWVMLTIKPTFFTTKE